MGNAPVIILGMHKSGTSMLAKIVEESGVFVGRRKDENNEALFFIKLNTWMLHQTNASWDNPYNFHFINTFLKEHVVRVLDRHLRGIRRIEFLGINKFFKYTDIRNLDIPWGWKDPRNTFTIEIWKELFPHAKILHIYRNPIDTAESLRRREEKIQREFKSSLKKKMKEFFLINKVGYGESLRVQSISESYKLWEEYVNKAFSLSREFKDNILHIRYESFLDNPKEGLTNILEFLEIEIEETHAAKVIQDVKSDNKYAFTKNEELVEAYNRVKNNEIMIKLKYNTIV